MVVPVQDVFDGACVLHTGGVQHLDESRNLDEMQANATLLVGGSISRVQEALHLLGQIVHSTITEHSGDVTQIDEVTGQGHRVDRLHRGYRLEGGL